MKLLLLVLGFALVLGCGGAGEKSVELKRQSVIQYVEADTTGRTILIANLLTRLPEGWSEGDITADRQKARLEIEQVEGDPEPGQVEMFFFGLDEERIAIEINRWYGQFLQPGYRPTVEVARREEFDSVDGMRVLLTWFPGTFKQVRRRGDPEDSVKPEWMCLSAVVWTPDGPWYFRGSGPKCTMRANFGKMKEFLENLVFVVM